ncbi:Kelch repeat-containing protein [Nocardioides sp.]|uniref:Kelch repeat-containing protein n=1 Tax=Nocardioides sp. TaxID=35761 RepID=UPI002ED04D18
MAAACVLALAMAGCSSDETPNSPEPSVTEPSGPSGTSAATDSDGVTTTSDVFPTWSAIEGLETPRDDFGSAVVGDDIWAMGGMTGERGNRLLSIEVLDTTTGSWSTSDVEMPVGVASFEVVAVGPRIYAFGGFDATSQAMDFAAVLDTRTGAWRDLPPLPHARYAHTVTRFGKRIYVIGGRDVAGEVAAVDVFDPRSERWTTPDPAMPRARVRDSHKTVAVPQGLIVAGGQRDFEDSAQVDLFDPRTGRWTPLPDLPEPMSRAGLAYAQGKLWISLHESAYVADARNPETWEPANPLTLSRHGMGFVVHDGFIYAIGGCALNPLRDVRTVDRMQLP